MALNKISTYLEEALKSHSVAVSLFETAVNLLIDVTEQLRNLERQMSIVEGYTQACTHFCGAGVHFNPLLKLLFAVTSRNNAAYIAEYPVMQRVADQLAA